MAMSSYERLDAWKRCHELVLEVYEVTRTWPTGERYGLTSQARRAAVSAAANIAEGSAKRGSRELARYLDISLGSLSEVGYLIRLAVDLELLSSKSADAFRGKHLLASQVTWKLYASLKRT
jgi:four helix bundle protein